MSFNLCNFLSRTLLNRNIGCIEIVTVSETVQAVFELNRNIGCIEIFLIRVLRYYRGVEP